MTRARLCYAALLSGFLLLPSVRGETQPDSCDTCGAAAAQGKQTLTPVDQLQAKRCGQVRAHLFAPHLLWLDKGLMEKVQKYGNLKDRRFDLDKNVTFMIGDLGYRDAGSGVRIGGGGWVGYKVFHSDVFTGTRVGSLTRDTSEVRAMTTIRIVPAHLGFLFEKGFSLGPVDLFVGTVLGGGALVVLRKTDVVDDVFIDVSADTSGRCDSDHSVAVAPVLAADLHAGVAVNVAPALQVGLEFVTLVCYAPDGFVTGTPVGDFYTVSPGLRLRVGVSKVRN